VAEEDTKGSSSTHRRTVFREEYGVRVEINKGRNDKRPEVSNASGS
jgi:hypothetical protein